MLSNIEAVFEVYLDDDRYSVPTLRFVVADNEARAWDLARELMRESEHHLGAELRIGDRRLGGLGTFAEASATGATSRRAVGQA